MSISTSVNLFKFPKIVAETEGMDYETWLTIRKNFIGGSEAAAVAGLSRYASPVTVYYDKISDEVSKIDSERMEAGRRMEPLIAEWFAERTGKHVVKQPYFYQHPVHTMMGANIDFGVYGENAIVECKNTTNDRDFADGLVPDEYWMQAQHYMAVTGAEKTYLVYLLHGWKLEWIEIMRNDDVIETMIQRQTDFWNTHIIAKQPPIFDGTNAAKELLKKMYPSEMEEQHDPADLPDDFDTLWEENEQLTKQETAIKKRKDEIKNLIASHIGERSCGVTSGRIFTWASQTRKSYTVEETTFRVLRSKVRKDAISGAVKI